MVSMHWAELSLFPDDRDSAIASSWIGQKQMTSVTYRRGCQGFLQQRVEIGTRRKTTQGSMDCVMACAFGQLNRGVKRLVELG